MDYTWLLVTRGVPHGAVLETLLFNIFINDTEEATKCAFVVSADDTRLGGISSYASNRTTIQGVPFTLEKCVDRNLMKVNKDKRQVLYLGKKTTTVPAGDRLAGEQGYGKGPVCLC